MNGNLGIYALHFQDGCSIHVVGLRSDGVTLYKDDTSIVSTVSVNATLCPVRVAMRGTTGDRI